MKPAARRSRIDLTVITFDSRSDFEATRNRFDELSRVDQGSLMSLRAVHATQYLVGNPPRAGAYALRRSNSCPASWRRARPRSCSTAEYGMRRTPSLRCWPHGWLVSAARPQPHRYQQQHQPLEPYRWRSSP
jgi:hypothetical protein